MFKLINKIPAGLFLVPMFMSSLFFTINPNMFEIGGLTQGLLGSEGVNFILGAVSFSAGTGLKLKNIKFIIFNQGVLLISRFGMSILLGILYIFIFGQPGILGLSAIAFITAISSINPAVYLASIEEYADYNDKSIVGLQFLFAIPLIPIIIYSFTGVDGFNWTPIISILTPIILGVIVGNIDDNFKVIFYPGVSYLVPFIGWKVGQGINLFEVFQSGFTGIILVIICYVINFYQYFLDTKILKNKGYLSLSMLSIAGVSVSTPLILSQSHPALSVYVTAATSQLLTASVLTSVTTSLIVNFFTKKNHLNT